MTTQYDPLRFQYRSGVSPDDFVSKSQTLKIINNRILLDEIPDNYNHVTITGYIEKTSLPISALTSTQFYVDYYNSYVYFNASEEGKSVFVSYKGKGIAQISADRVYVISESEPDAILNLQNIVTGGDLVLTAAGTIGATVSEVQGARDSGAKSKAFADLGDRLEEIETDAIAYEVANVAQLALKANQSALDTTNANVASKVDQTTYNEQLADTVNVNARQFKTGGTTWEDAIEAAASYANSLYLSEQPQTGDAAWVSNVIVKIPRGKYTVTRAMTIPVGVDLDLENCTFVASPSNKSIDCFNVTGHGYRNNYDGGVFVGFRKSFIFSTGNADTSRVNFKGQTFHECQYGIDTLSYALSRSTVVVLEKFTSYKTDVLIKAHADMCTLKDGWITASGNADLATVYNQSFMKVENVVFVPVTGMTRWFDNYAVDGGIVGSSSDRGIEFSHCRFGGEAGAPTIVYNYAKFSTSYSDKSATNISFDKCLIQCPGKFIVKLFALPNKISMTNCDGMTDLVNGLISLDGSADLTGATKEFVNIYIDEYRSAYPLFDNDVLYKFFRGKNLTEKTFKNVNFCKDLVVDSTGTHSVISIPVSLIPYGAGNEATHPASIKVAFLLSVIGSSGSTYTMPSLFYVTLVGHYTSNDFVKISCTPLAVIAGGLSDGETTAFVSAEWNDTGSDSKASGSVTDAEVVKIHVTKSNVKANMIPLSGTDYPKRF